MTEKKLSRRDAIKLLGAAIGGAALSTLPPKWSKPVLAASQLPVHAQTSVVSGSCTENSLVIEFLTFTGIFLGNGAVQVNVSPDFATTDGAPVAGDLFSWDCSHTGCFSGTFPLDVESAPNPEIVMRFTTFSSSPVVVTWNTSTPVHTISVNFDTGAIAVDGCAPGCTCLILT